MTSIDEDLRALPGQQEHDRPAYARGAATDERVNP